MLLVCLFVSLVSCGNDKSDTINCENCGIENEITAKYCKSCGKSIYNDDNEKENDDNTNKDETLKNNDWPLTHVPSNEKNDKYLKLNEQNRVQNEGSFLIKNGWIYGQQWDDDGKSQFVKVRTDYTDWTVLDNGFARQINVVDNYIYYMKNGSDYGIYKMKTSGEDKRLIVKAFGSMQIVGNYIYYADYMYNGVYDDASGDDSCYHLYRCDLDGRNITEIISKPVFHVFVFDDGILYQDDRDNMSLHICDLQGKNDTKLNNSTSYWPIYDGEYIYYVCEDKNGTSSIWKVRPDGNENQQVAPYSVSNNMLLTEKYIYFVYTDDSDRLYRINKDGSNLTLITQDTHIKFVEFFDNLIKYTKYDDEYEYIEANYFCEYDGSGKEEFEP